MYRRWSRGISPPFRGWRDEMKFTISLFSREIPDMSIYRHYAPSVADVETIFPHFQTRDWAPQCVTLPVSGEYLRNKICIIESVIAHKEADLNANTPMVTMNDDCQRRQVACYRKLPMITAFGEPIQTNPYTPSNRSCGTASAPHLSHPGRP